MPEAAGARLLRGSARLSLLMAGSWPMSDPDTGAVDRNEWIFVAAGGSRSTLYRELV